MNLFLRLGVALAAFALPSWAQSVPPSLLHLQARLANAAGSPLQGPVNLEIRIYDAAIAGNLLWSENQTVTALDGVVNLLLGATTPVDPTLFDGTVRFLALKVGTDPEMTPRRQIASIPFAMRAGRVAALDIGTTIPNGLITSAHLLDLTVSTADLADGAVTTPKIALGAVNGSAILDGGVGSADLADGSVTSTKIAGGAVGSTALAANSVATAAIQSNAVSTAKLQDGSVTSLKIADLGVASADLADGAVTSAKIGAGAVGAGALAPASVAEATLQNNAVSTAKIQAGAIGSAQIADLSIATADLANSAVTSAKIAAGAVGSAEIADLSVATADLANNAVTSAKIADGSITTTDVANGTLLFEDLGANGAASGQIAKFNGVAWAAAADNDTTYTGTAPVTVAGTTVSLAADGITAAHLAPDSVGTSEIADLGVATADLANNAVTTAKIAAGAVGTAEIADLGVATADLANNAVTTAKIAASAVGSAQIADLGVATADLANNAVTTAKIAAGAVGSAEIADLGVGTADLAAGAVTSPKIAAGAVGSAQIADGSVTSADVANGTLLFEDIGPNGALAGQVPKFDGVAWTAGTDNGVAYIATPPIVVAGSTISIAPDGITAAEMAPDSVGTSEIANGAITNADVSLTAAISGTKVAPNFGSQTISTSGMAGFGTATPASRVHVRGPGGVGALAMIEDTNDAASSIEFATSFLSWHVGQNQPPDDTGATDAFFIHNASDGVTRLLIEDATGRIGVGTTSPTARVHVIEGVSSTAFHANNTVPSGITIGVRGEVSSVFGDAVLAVGDLSATGTKSFVQPHPTDPTKEIRFVCLEGNESGTYFRGSSHLVNGRAVIEVPEEFRLVTAPEGLTVQLTPVGAPTSLWIESESLERIVVRADRDVRFHYFVNGVRRGFQEFEALDENRLFVPEVRGVPYGTQYPEALRRILVENGTLNGDFTPNEETAERLGRPLRDPSERPERPRRAATEAPAGGSDHR